MSNSYMHWCPGCERAHQIFDNWTFNGDVDRPTFAPSVKVTYNGRDADQHRHDGERTPSAVCHYYLSNGNIQFLVDCTHDLACQTVALPILPPHLTDG